MIRALIDTDVILDWFLNRPPFVNEARAIWIANEQGLFEAYISAITPINVVYVARKTVDNATIQQMLSRMLLALQICPIDKTVLQSALTLAISDYEDATQCAGAMALGLDAIVTRNLKDYTGATIPVYAPADFLKFLAGNP